MLALRRGSGGSPLNPLGWQPEAVEDPEERLPVVGAEGEEADEVDAAAEDLQIQTEVVDDVGEVGVAVLLVVARQDDVQQPVEAGRQGQDDVGDGGDEDGDGQLPLPLPPRVLVGRGLHVLGRCHVVTPEGPDGKDVEEDLQEERHVGHKDLHGQAEGVVDILVAQVEVRDLGPTLGSPAQLVLLRFHGNHELGRDVEVEDRGDHEGGDHDRDGELGQHEVLHVQRAENGAQPLRGDEAEDDVGPSSGDDAAEADGVQLVEAEEIAGRGVAVKAGPHDQADMGQQEEDLREAEPQDVDAGGAAHALLDEDDDVADGDGQREGEEYVADGHQDVAGIETLSDGQNVHAAIPCTGLAQVLSLGVWGWLQDHRCTVWEQVL